MFYVLFQIAMKSIELNREYVIGLGLNRQQTITWTIVDPVKWWLYASSGPNE